MSHTNLQDTLTVDQQVVRADITMNDPLTLEVRQRTQHITREPRNRPLLQPQPLFAQRSASTSAELRFISSISIRSASSTISTYSPSMLSTFLCRAPLISNISFLRPSSFALPLGRRGTIFTATFAPTFMLSRCDENVSAYDGGGGVLE